MLEMQSGSFLSALLTLAQSEPAPADHRAWVYGGFIAFVMVLLALDLGVFHRGAQRVSPRSALGWTGFFVLLAIGFTGLVYVMYEHRWMGLGMAADGVTARGGFVAASEFLQGWVLEYSLSVDNLFVIALIFAHFKVPQDYQHRVLFWGILGALVLRGVMIFAGAQLIERVHWVIYLFGALLLFTSWKMLVTKETDFNPEQSFTVRLARKFLPVSEGFDGQKFFTIVRGKRAITPLFLVLLVVEITDVVFAVDSIPAIFGVTKDPFLVFTSNVFAIMGLRSLYFALAGLMDRFRYLKVSLVLVLAFIGVKMLISGGFHIDSRISLGVIVAVLAGGVAMSVMVKPKAKVEPVVEGE